MSWHVGRIAGVIVLLAAFGALATASLFSMELPEIPARSRIVRPLPAPLPDALIDSATAAAVGQAPFRRHRTATRPYDPTPPEQIAQAEVPVAPKPAIALSGIVWGETPLAALEGVPGREGSVVLGAGDTAGGLRVRRITREAVIIAGFDTVWSLRVRERP